MFAWAAFVGPSQYNHHSPGFALCPCPTNIDLKYSILAIHDALATHRHMAPISSPLYRYPIEISPTDRLEQHCQKCLAGCTGSKRDKDEKRARNALCADVAVGTQSLACTEPLVDPVASQRRAMAPYSLAIEGTGPMD